jgi:hypothetical protein
VAARQVVFTSLTGGYEALMEQPVSADQDVDFICFTDDATLTSSSWDVRYLPRALPADPIRSSRRIKILAQEYLPDYDESLYIDNSVRLTVAPQEIFDAWLTPDAPLALLQHSFRGPLGDEFTAVIDQQREASWVCEEQLADYGRTDPEALKAPTLWTGLMLRRHSDPTLQPLMQLWWEHVLRYSRRDQLSLPIVLRAQPVATSVHQIDNQLSPFHEWPRWTPGTYRNLPTARPDGPEERILQLEREAGRLQADLIALRRSSDEIRDRRTFLEGYIEEVRASTSWRVTKPLRLVADAFRTVDASADEHNEAEIPLRNP